jgi:hypothetical protein
MGSRGKVIMKSQRQKKLLFMRKDWGEIIDVHITDFV